MLETNKEQEQEKKNRNEITMSYIFKSYFEHFLFLRINGIEIHDIIIKILLFM